MQEANNRRRTRRNPGRFQRKSQRRRQRTRSRQNLRTQSRSPKSRRSFQNLEKKSCHGVKTNPLRSWETVLYLYPDCTNTKQADGDYTVYRCNFKCHYSGEATVYQKIAMFDNTLSPIYYPVASRHLDDIASVHYMPKRKWTRTKKVVKPAPKKQ